MSFVLHNFTLNLIFQQLQRSVNLQLFVDNMFNGSPSSLLENKVIQKLLDPLQSYQSKNTSTSLRRFELEVCIDIGNGTTGFIKLDSNSNPLSCALDFCQDYNIDKQVAPLLAQSIVSQLREEANNDKNNRNSPILKHKLSQSMVQETQPQLRQITDDIVNRRINRRQSESACGARIRYRKNTQQYMPAEEQQQFPYRPRINQISKQIVQKLNKKNIIDSVEETKKKKEIKVSKLKKQNEFKQFSECSFRPKINAISEKVDLQMNRNRRSSNKRYQQLYINSFIQERSKEHSRKTSFEKNRFHPQINKISKTLMEGTNFQQRQSKFKKKPQINQSNNIFKPKTGRMPKQRNVKQLPVGQYLYQQARQKIFERATISANNSRRPSIVSNKSQQLFSNLRSNKLREVFQLLDTKNSGVIQYDDLNFENLDKDTLAIFEPIFFQMKQIEVSLTLQEFIEAGSKLIFNLTPYQRGILLNTKKKIEPIKKFPFQPQINKVKKSSKMERKDIYIRCLMEKKKHRQRMQSEKQQIVKNQLYECTFKPKINKLYKD